MVDDLIVWGSIAVGLILCGAGLKASWYFWRQHRLLGSRNWVMSAIFRTSATITAACLILTFNRAFMMFFGVSVWNMAISGIMAMWILLIPWFLFHAFVRHEGAPLDRTETIIEQEDREVGAERRTRQEQNRTRPE